MNSTLHFGRGSRVRAAVVGIGAALLLGACASTPPAPTAQLQAAQQAISNAERTEAGQYAVGELSEARSKLVAANTAVTDERMDVAAQLAEESRVGAEFASAKTAAVKAKAVNAEMKSSTGTLIDEMQRTSGDPQ